MHQPLFTPVRLLSCMAALVLAASAGAGATRQLQQRPSGLGLDAVRVWTAPAVDVEGLAADDAAAWGSAPGLPHRVGLPLLAALSPQDHGTWEDLPDGSQRWRLRVRSPGARWLVLGFGTWRIQSGGRLTVYDPARTTELGPYGAEQIRPHGQLWLPPIPGDEVVLDLHWPAALRGVAPEFHLGRVSHGYRGWADIGRSGDGTPDECSPADTICTIDINCPLGANWQDEKLGVVLLLVTGGGGTYGCTGALINNTDVDCTPYVLTAAHCAITDTEAASATIRFNFERPLCGTGTATVNQTVTGSQIVSDDSATDFTLLRLDEPVPSNFAVYYAGWNASPDPAGATWTIHHPCGLPKAISFSADPPIDGQFFGSSHWRVTQWEQGVTEPGSSGAPLYDENKRIIGQLHGGLSECYETPEEYDEFGKLARAWNGPFGADPNDRLHDWLDPDGTGVVAINGIDSSYCFTPRPRLESVAALVLDPSPANANGVLEPGESAALQIELLNSGSLGATGITGTLSVDNPLVTIVDAQAVWPDLRQSLSATGDGPFAIEVDPALVCGTPVRFTLNLSATEGSWNETFDFDAGTRVRTVDYQDGFETGAPGWTTASRTQTGGPQAQLVENPWTLSGADSNTGTTSWFVPNILERSDGWVVSPTRTLPERAVLEFAHRMNSERDIDGGVLEYSVNGGQTWLDAGSRMTSGGYDSTILTLFQSPLGGRAAWSGDFGNWRSVEVDLTDLAGQQVAFRWRFATNWNTPDEGWFVDDVRIVQVDVRCSQPRFPRQFGGRCDTVRPSRGNRPTDCSTARPRPPLPRK